MHSDLAKAKLNLYLHLTGKRADGYHLLDSLFAFTDLADELEALPAESLSLKVTGPFAELSGEVEENIVLKAARLLQEVTGSAQGAKIILKKNIPAGAGFGGGSADAASTLRLLNRMWKLKLGAKTLIQLGAQLGADVPACVLSETMQVSGVGDELGAQVVLMQPLHLLLIYPGKSLGTPEVYKQFRGPFSEPAPLPGIQTGKTLIKALEKRQNDLEAPACELLPEIADVLIALREQEGCQIARMSGSGSACFGVFDRKDSAASAAKALKRRKRGWWVMPAVC